MPAAWSQLPCAASLMHRSKAHTSPSPSPRSRDEPAGVSPSGNRPAPHLQGQTRRCHLRGHARLCTDAVERVRAAGPAAEGRAPRSLDRGGPVPGSAATMPRRGRPHPGAAHRERRGTRPRAAVAALQAPRVPHALVHSCSERAEAKGPATKKARVGLVSEIFVERDSELTCGQISFFFKHRCNPTAALCASLSCPEFEDRSRDYYTARKNNLDRQRIESTNSIGP